MQVSSQYQAFDEGVYSTRRAFVGGAWLEGEPTLPAMDPSTGEAFQLLAVSGESDVALACDAAERAFGPWRAMGGHKRAGFLRAIAAGLAARQGRLVQQIMRNIGKPRGDAELDLADTIACFEYYADLADNFDSHQVRAVALSDDTLFGETRLEPYGPAALIIAWNFPLVTTAWKLAPALAVGCTAVLKPSEFAALPELVFGEIAQEIGLAAGVLNIVVGDGQIGADLCRNPKIRKISFTGSNTTGQKVMAIAAERIVPVSLELGGKSPIIVLEDADIEDAVRIIASGIFANAGQVCSATSRLIVAEAIADPLLERLVQTAEQIVIDGPCNPAATMGPIVTRAQRDKVAAYFAIAAEEGLKPSAGGRVLNDRPGYFVMPTIYADVPVDSRLWRDEIFGPVLAVRRAASDEEAIELANDSVFGLAATVVGTDPDRLARIADALVAGHVWINTGQLIFPNTAWGGMKSSGIGRELGPWGLFAYGAVKHLTRRVGG